MDSVSQIALGAAVGVAVMGRRTALWKAALWGGVCGTLPDLDALIDFGDPVRNMTYHRAESHALFWLTLAAPLIAWPIAWLHGELDRFRRWWLAVWAVLVTHPLLDVMTIYGTQLLLPFTEEPYGVGSLFIIDPLYTLPLLVGTIAALILRGGPRALRANLAGLLLSTAYVGWSVLAQQQAASTAQAALRAQGIAAQQVLVTPAPFNTLLWRVVAMTPEHYYEGFTSLLDADASVRFDRFDRGEPLREELRGNWSVERMVWFSDGFYRMAQEGARVLISDLRMGQEPAYVFNFVVAEKHSAAQALAVPQQVTRRPDVARTLRWLWPRMLGERLPPPR
jgi:inner membrane protein